MNNYSQAMLEQCKVEQSLFSTDNDYKHSMFECPFEYENVEKELDNRFNEGIYGYLEKKILQALYVFHFLNRKNIERYVALISGKELKLKNVLNTLEKDGIVRKHSFIYTSSIYAESMKEAGEWKNFVIYELTKAGYHYAAIRGIGYKTYNYAEPNEIEHLQEIIFESLSAAQWHISMMETNKIVKNRFMTKSSFGETVVKVPSFLRARGVSSIGDISFIGIPIPRNLTSVTVRKLVGKIMRIRGFLFEEGYINPVLVYIADKTERAEALAELMGKIEKYRDIPFCFCTDANTRPGKNPLNHIYKIDRENNKQKYYRLNFS